MLINSYVFGEVDPYFSNVSLLLHGNGTNGSTSIIDSSQTPQLATAIGNTQISTVQSKFGDTSIATDGTGDYVLLNTNMTIFEFSGDFTIEGFWWFNFNNLGYQPMLGSAVSADQTGFSLILESNNTLAFYGATTSIWNTVLLTSTIPTVNTWHHIAVSRSGSTVRLFLNGTIQGSIGSSNFIRSGSSLRIGGYQYFPGGARSLNGFIDEVRITKGISRYTGNFTPPTSAFPNK